MRYNQKWAYTLVATALTVALGVGCGGSSGGTTAASIESYEGPIASADVSRGADVYATYCEGCHPGGQEGSGDKITDIMWPAAKMRQQIREGEGKMPGFGSDQISSEDLEALLAYTVTLGATSAN